MGYKCQLHSLLPISDQQDPSGVVAVGVGDPEHIAFDFCDDGRRLIIHTSNKRRASAAARFLWSQFDEGALSPARNGES